MNKALQYAKQIAYSTEETLMFTYEMAKKYDDSSGCYVECGVAAGAQIIAMRAGAPDKEIHAFDSFEGIPLPSNRDDQMPGIGYLKPWEQSALPDPGKQFLVSTGATSVRVEDFWEHIHKSGVGNKQNILVHKGWFERTVSSWDDRKISILRLDGDLYNSTIVCLKGLYRSVLRGGIVIVDDWQLPGCRSAVYDFLKTRQLHCEIQFVSNIAYWIKP